MNQMNFPRIQRGCCAFGWIPLVVLLPMAAEAQERAVLATHTPQPVTIDGMPDPAWDVAHVVDDFYAWDEEENPIPARSQTRVRVLWDDDHLYVRAELDDKDIYALHTEHNSRTWDDDVFELFVQPRQGSDRYYEFHVTPRNITLQLGFPSTDREGRVFRDHIFDGGMQSAVTLDGIINDWKQKDRGWVVEIAIPFSAFSEAAPPPDDGTVWHVAFCRYDYSYYLHDHPHEADERAVETSSSVAFPRRGFHQTEYYHPMTFHRP